MVSKCDVCDSAHLVQKVSSEDRTIYIDLCEEHLEATRTFWKRLNAEKKAGGT